VWYYKRGTTVGVKVPKNIGCFNTIDINMDKIYLILKWISVLYNGHIKCTSRHHLFDKKKNQILKIHRYLKK